MTKVSEARWGQINPGRWESIYVRLDAITGEISDVPPTVTEAAVEAFRRRLYELERWGGFPDGTPRFFVSRAEAEYVGRSISTAAKPVMMHGPDCPSCGVTL